MYVRNLIRLHIYQVTLYKQKEIFFFQKHFVC